MDKKAEGKTSAVKGSEAEEAQPILHDFKEADVKKMINNKVIGIFIVAAVLGLSTGYVLASKGGTSAITMNKTSGSSADSGQIEGSNDLKTFKDTAEGKLDNGGIEGEGQFHLVRPGGDSQNVYLVSSTVDLSKYIGKKIKVWGQTQTAKKAGWLMDVGRVEVL